MLPNCYKINGLDFDTIFNFFDEIKNYHFPRLFNVERQKRNGGRFSKIHYYKISDFDRILRQLSIVDEVYAKLDITMSNDKWRLMYNLFEIVHIKIYPENKVTTTFDGKFDVPKFYGEFDVNNVNKYIVLYLLKVLVQTNEKELIRIEEYQKLK